MDLLLGESILIYIDPYLIIVTILLNYNFQSIIYFKNNTYDYDQILIIILNEFNNNMRW